MADVKPRGDVLKLSGNLHRWVTWLLLVLGATLVLERFGALGLELFKLDAGGNGARRLALACCVAFPEVLYLLALWWIRQALGEFAQGKLYAPTIAQMLDRVGVTLAIGAFFNVFLLPTIARSIGFAPGYVVAFDVAGLVLGTVGLALKVIAHVLRNAAQMQAELDEIF